MATRASSCPGFPTTDIGARGPWHLGSRASCDDHTVTHLTIREGLSFCRVADRFVFLDLPRDRYFCLSPEADRAFGEVVAGSSPTGRSLIPTSILRTACRGDPPITPVAILRPRLSLLDQGGSAPMTAVSGMLARRLACRTWLRILPLAAILRRLERLKAQIPASSAPPEVVERVATSYRRAALIASPHDLCLADSIAVAGALYAAGVRCDLVMAVKLRPFQAHCWVQVGDTVVNDDLDAVRLFTPILIV